MMRVPAWQFLVCGATLVFSLPKACVAEPLTYQNPVYSGSMPDPSVMHFGGEYYAYGTTGAGRLPDGRIFTVLRSLDLVHWQRVGGAVIPPVADPRHQYWAPEITRNDGVYYLYYALGALEPERFAIRVATNNSPAGPFTDSGAILADCESNRFTIDPFPFKDDDGQWYFFYSRNFPFESEGCHAGTGIVVDRMFDMKRLAGDCHVVVRGRYDWTLYQAHRYMEVYHETFDWHTVEGPCVVKHDGKYYCFYSGSNWQSTNYGVDYVVADQPLGPYSGQADHPRVLKTISCVVRGPGHHSIVLGPDGLNYYIVYHAWDKDMNTRQLCVDKLQWTPDGPRCTPTSTPQPIP